jgi:hypothetical protein
MLVAISPSTPEWFERERGFDGVIDDETLEMN